MEIKLTTKKVADALKGYEDNQEDGVVAYDGKLDIRPPYQRAYVYEAEERNAVIHSILHGFPLNVMYWVDKGDDLYEVLDGQQRTISIGKYITGEYSIDDRGFDNLTEDQQNKILNYELMIYICKGEPSEKLAWFEVVNVAGKELTAQELLNAAYTGPWLSSAKSIFSRTNCPAYGLATERQEPLMDRTPINQEYLETALKWISENNIAKYMGKHQHDENADELWEYFQRVIAWARETFPHYREPMKKVEWGFLYNEHGKRKLNANKLEKKVAKLMEFDETISSLKGIYSYVLDGVEKHLSIRSFKKIQKSKMYERQKGICPTCKNHFKQNQMHGDHIKKWHEGGRTTLENGRLLCAECNLKLGG